jgi:outer membrane lipoprotein carrier protein
MITTDVMMALWLGATSVSTPAPAQHTLAPSREAEGLLGRVQDTYRNGGDLTATFSQTYIDRLRPIGRTESGRLWAKKDGRARWRYEVPEVKEFVFDGKRAYFYEPENAQVTIFDNFVDSPVWDALRFVWGQGEIGHAFRAEDCRSCQIGQRKSLVVALWPKEPLANIDHLWLGIDPTALTVCGAIVFDPLGNRTEYAFEEIKFGAKLPDAKFVFTIPKGVSVLRPTAQGTESPAAATGTGERTPSRP